MLAGAGRWRATHGKHRSKFRASATTCAAPRTTCGPHAAARRLPGVGGTGRTIAGVALGLGVPATTPLRAQLRPQGDADLVDRVVAIVGDSAVLYSQILEEEERLKVQGVTIPTDPRKRLELDRQVLDSWISRVLVLQAAARDTLIHVDEDRVSEIVDGEIDQRTKGVGGKQAFLQALTQEGLTLAEYRDLLTQQVRQQQIQQLYIQSKLRTAPPVQVTEEELREAFQRASSQLQTRPKLVTIRQIVLRPEPSDSARAAAKALAEDLLKQIREGADFEDLARRYSNDPGTARLGGDLGWFRRGRMVKAFEDAAFALADGQVSDVVETDFGFHIIKIERSRSGERKGRHILIAPKITENDIQRTRDLASDLIERIRGGADIASLYDEYSDPLAPDSLTVPMDQLGSLPPGYDVLKTATDGQVLGPIEYQGPRGETRVAVLEVVKVREAGAYTFEDLKERLASQIRQQKQIQRILDELRAATYVEIRM